MALVGLTQASPAAAQVRR